MKQYYVKDLVKDMEFMDFFLAKESAIKQGGNGKEYLDIKLGDKTGEISGKKWDVQDQDRDDVVKIKAGDLVKIKGIVTEWQGIPQVRIHRIRLATEADGLEISEYVKAAPEAPEDMFAYIMSVADAMEDEDLKKVCRKMLEDNEEKLMYYPAASRNHHAIFAGLLFHMKRMLMTGLRICEVYSGLNRDLVATGVIIHDMEKLNEIESDQNGISPGYTMEGQLLGHIVMGVKYLEQLASELDVPREKALMMEHMILSHHYEPEFGSPKRPLFPEAEVLHYLDIMDARLYDMFDALENVGGGDFSEKVWTLDNRRLYKPESF